VSKPIHPGALQSSCRGVKRLTSGTSADAVFDPVGIAQDVALGCVAHGGKLLIAGFAAGSIPAYAANRILLRGCSVIGIRAGEAGRHNPQMRRRELEPVYALAAQGLAGRWSSPPILCIATPRRCNCLPAANPPAGSRLRSARALGWPSGAGLIEIYLPSQTGRRQVVQSHRRPLCGIRAKVGAVTGKWCST
jgi:hypothetical protein